MKKSLLLLLFLSCLNLFGYSDSDIDGVEDRYDKCPNTSLTDLVDMTGCSVESLSAEYYYDIIVGLSYTASDYIAIERTDTLTNSYQFDYYYKKFSFQLSTSFFSTSSQNYSDSGMYDTYLGGSYQFNPTHNLTLLLSAGVYMPTYTTELHNNNADYTTSLNLSYQIENYSLFGTYSYTLINDDDYNDATLDISYKNTTAYSLGIGKNLTAKLYLSGAYNISESIYTDVEDLKTVSLYGYYSFDQNWFGTFSYAYGLNDSAAQNYIAFKLGYYF